MGVTGGKQVISRIVITMWFDVPFRQWRVAGTEQWCARVSEVVRISA